MNVFKYCLTCSSPSTHVEITVTIIKRKGNTQITLFKTCGNLQHELTIIHIPRPKERARFFTVTVLGSWFFYYYLFIYISFVLFATRDKQKNNNEKKGIAVYKNTCGFSNKSISKTKDLVF